MKLSNSVTADAVACYLDLLFGEHRDSTLTELTRVYGHLSTTLLRPYLILRTEMDRRLALAGVVARAVKRGAEALVESPALRRELGLPQYLDALLDLELRSARGSAFSRLDMFVSDDVPRVIEFNPHPGFDVSEAITKAYERLPISSAFSRRFPFQPVFPSRLARRAYDIDCEERGVSWPDHPTIVRSARRSASLFSFAVALPSEFSYANDTLRLNGEPVHTLELQAWTELMAELDGDHPLLAAIKRGHVRVLHGISKGVISGYKHTLELLSNPQFDHLFTADMLPALRQCVPWTRVVRERTTTYAGREVDLLRLLSDERERFVLKPSGGSSGSGVLLGWACSDETWQKTLQSRRVMYVAQERVTGEQVEFPVSIRGAAPTFASLGVDYCPYVLAERELAGCMVRVSNAGLLNVAQGGSAACVWILDA